LPLSIHAGEVSVQFFQRSVSLLLGQMRSNDRSGGERFDADGIVFGYRPAKQALWRDTEPRDEQSLPRGVEKM
jgi:hypothetical protein